MSTIEGLSRAEEGWDLTNPVGFPPIRVEADEAAVVAPRAVTEVAPEMQAAPVTPDSAPHEQAPRHERARRIGHTIVNVAIIAGTVGGMMVPFIANRDKIPALSVSFADTVMAEAEFSQKSTDKQAGQAQSESESADPATIPSPSTAPSSEPAPAPASAPAPTPEAPVPETAAPPAPAPGSQGSAPEQETKGKTPDDSNSKLECKLTDSKEACKAA